MQYTPLIYRTVWLSQAPTQSPGAPPFAAPARGAVLCPRARDAAERTVLAPLRPLAPVAALMDDAEEEERGEGGPPRRASIAGLPRPPTAPAAEAAEGAVTEGAAETPLPATRSAPCAALPWQPCSRA